MKYKQAYEEISDKYSVLKEDYDVLRRDSKSLVNYLLRIKKKCNENNLWFMASHDPYKPPNAEAQQGPMVTKLFEMVDNIKRKMK